MPPYWLAFWMDFIGDASMMAAIKGDDADPLIGPCNFIGGQCLHEIGAAKPLHIYLMSWPPFPGAIQ